MAASWSVSRQAADQVNITGSGDPVTGVRIFFTTGEGNSGSVFVPDTVYHNTKAVREAIAVMADQMDAIGALHS